MYTFSYNAVYKYDLKTKVSEGKVATYPTTTNNGYGDGAIGACVFDDYKVAIYAAGQNHAGTYRRLFIFNSVDNTIIEPIPVFTGGEGTASHGHTGTAPGSAIFVPQKRKIYFFDPCANGYYTNEDSRDVYGQVGIISVYNIDLNTWNKIYTRKVTEATRYNIELQNGIFWSEQNGEYVYYYNGTAGQNKLFKINTSNDSVTVEAAPNFATVHTGIEYNPGQFIAFEGSKVKMIDVYNRAVLSDVVVPDAPYTPWQKGLNRYDNQIISMNNVTMMKLPFVAQEPEVKQPVWTIFKGQQFAGESTLEIIGKPTIQTYWQTATETFDINLGEYDSYGGYRLLIKSGEQG